MSRRQMERLEAGPLVEAIDRLGVMGRDQSPHLRRAYQRAKATGRVTWSAADTLAVQVAGRHPAVIFGRAWWSL